MRIGKQCHKLIYVPVLLLIITLKSPETERCPFV